MPKRLTDTAAATEILGEPVEVGIWLSRFRYRWYHELLSGTGTELDLILVVLLLPVVLVRWLVQSSSGRNQETGPVFAVLTNSEIVFFAGREGFYRRHITRIYNRRTLDDIATIAIDNSKQTPVRFVCVDSPEILLYYQGPRLALEKFISLST